MTKEYIWSIKGFATLEKALNDWFTMFKWDVWINNENRTSFESLAKFAYSVEWNFSCSNNKLTTLIWCPQFVAGDFICANNNLTTLEWSPTSIGWDVLCNSNKFIPLKKKEWKYNIFQLWEDIYIGNPGTKLDSKDIEKLISFNLYDYETWISNRLEWSRIYYTAFNNFRKATTKLNKNDITETDIIFKWKKFKRKILGL
jgi:hypothetical protein